MRKIKIRKTIRGYSSWILPFCIFVALLSCEREVSVSPPDEPPPNGKIVINSYPNGFKIFLNEKDRVRFTPDSLTWLDSGRYEIRLTKDLFNDTAYVFDIEDKERKEIFIDFSKNPSMLGKLFVESTPEGAEIFLNDSNTTQATPHMFEGMLPGKYKITLKLDDHEEITFSRELSSGGNISIESTLLNTTIWDKYVVSELGLETDELTCVARDLDENIWIGSRNGILIFDGVNWSVLNMVNQKQLPSEVINSIAVDKNNVKWIATNDGMAIAQNKTILFNYNSFSRDFPTGLPTNVFTSVYISYIGELPRYYFGTDLSFGTYGYGLIHELEQKFYSWELFRNVISQFVTSVFASDSTVFAGTENNGLYVFDITNEGGVIKYNFSDIQTVDNPNDKVSTIVQDNEGGLWVGFVPQNFDRKGGLIYHKDGSYEKYGFIYRDSHINTMHVDRNGFKWLGTSYSVLFFEDHVDNSIILTEKNTGLKIENVVGITDDEEGNIWILTRYDGIFKLKDLDEYR